MKIVIAGITDEGLRKLQELLSSPFNEKDEITVTDIQETTLRDQSIRTRIEILVPDHLAIKAGHIVELVWGYAVATIIT
jgi:hypothetical protein